MFHAMKRKILFILTFQVMFMTASGADLAFLLDASGSIGKNSYEDMKGFINEVIENFHVSNEDTHVGVVSFGTRATTEIQFKAPQNLDKIKSSVLGIKYYAGGTRMDLGLKESHLRLFSAEYGMRANVPHVLLAITDGKSDLGYLRTKQESQRLKDDGIVTFAMGIGSSVNSAEMEALASEPSHVFRFPSVRQMLPADKGLEISLALCSVGRTSAAVIFPVITQHSLKHHVTASRTAYDDLECALMCIKHSSCYSFNFHTPSRLCELSYAKRTDFPGDFSFDLGSAYSELKFERI